MLSVMRRRDFAVLAGPSILVMAALLILPFLQSVVWSFQRVSYGSGGSWIGFENYANALGDPVFRTAAAFTIVFAVVKTFVTVCIGFGLALLLNQARRSRPAFLGFLLVPYVIPSVIGATAFSWLFDSNFGGLANWVLDKFGIGQVLWFSNTWPNRGLILLDVVWNEAPFVMLVLLGALQGISRESLEAATVDGANWVQRQRWIVLPALYPMIRFIALISLMDGLRLFDPLVPLAPTAEATQTLSVTLYVYQRAFARGQQDIGLGSAVNIMLILVLVPLVAPFIRQVYREVVGR